MNKEQTLFLQCLRDFIHEEATARSYLSNIDENVLYEYAKKHEVTAILYKQTEIESFKVDYYTQLLHSRNILKIKEKIHTKLETIEHFIVKGPVIAEYYPIPELRSMGDLDVYVHSKDRLKADKILREMDFQPGPQWGEWIYSGNGFCVELHTAFVYKYSQCTSTEKQRDFFNDFWEYVQNGSLDVSFHVLYLFMHLRKHIMETGVGFRQFMDIAVLTRNCHDIHWCWIQEQAKKLDLLSFIQRVLMFNQKCFDVLSPLAGEKMKDEVYEILCQRIFSDGVFGFSNPENQGNKLINEFQHGKKSQINIQLFKNHFFLPYENMIQLPHLSWLQGKPYFLPFAWLVRAALRITEFKTIRKRYFTTKKEAKMRQKYYQYWKIE